MVTFQDIDITKLKTYFNIWMLLYLFGTDDYSHCCMAQVEPFEEHKDKHVSLVCLHVNI